jgi:hypothetical protein
MNTTMTEPAIQDDPSNDKTRKSESITAARSTTVAEMSEKETSKEAAADQIIKQTDAQTFQHPTTIEDNDKELILNAPSSILLQRILSYDGAPGVADAGGGTLQTVSDGAGEHKNMNWGEEDGAEESKEEIISVQPDGGPPMLRVDPPSTDDVSTTSWEISKLVQSRQLGR